MNILLAHNYYRFRGGEDVVYESERDLLRQKGNTVVEFVQNSSTIAGSGLLRTGLSALWSSSTIRELGGILKQGSVDIVHVHNTFPLISPSIYSVCRKAGVPLVQTIHNYRWLCAAGILYRDGNVCRECLNTTVPYPAVLHKCYHGSRLSSMAAAGIQLIQRGTKVLKDDIALFIAPTIFAKKMFPPAVISPEKVVIKPHFLAVDPGPKRGRGSQVLYLGRLSEEKGVRTMLKAWRRLPEVPLSIVGNGPLATEMASIVAEQQMKSVNLAGYRSELEALQILKESSFLVVPSTCYETFSRVIVEAFACGVPVVVPSHGAFPELVAEGRTGFWFEAGNESDLARIVRWGWSHPDEMARMGENARREFEEKYTAEANYESLIQIYRQVITEGVGVS